jgi:SMC interacting uncharacterized protein involved in chromosome segregation
MSNISSINCRGIDLFDSAVDINDLVFLQMVMSLEESDAALSNSMKEMRRLNNEKKAITDQISELNQILKTEQALEDPNDLNSGPLSAKTALTIIQDSHGRHGLNFCEFLKNEMRARDIPFPETAAELEKIIEDIGPEHLGEVINLGYTDLECGSYVYDTYKNEVKQRHKDSKNEIEAEIEKLRGDLENLNTDSNVMMMDLNRMINKRAEIVQMASSIESKCHSTMMAIIGNIGR